MMHNAVSDETPVYGTSRRTAIAESVVLVSWMGVFGVVTTTNYLHDKELSAVIKGMEAVGRYVKRMAKVTYRQHAMSWQQHPRNILTTKTSLS